jgi:hypothetical protein
MINLSASSSCLLLPLVLLSSGCPQEVQFACPEKGILPESPVQLQRIAAFRENESGLVKIRAFDLAAPAGTVVIARHNNAKPIAPDETDSQSELEESELEESSTDETAADSNGRFALLVAHSEAFISLDFTLPDGTSYTSVFQVRDRETAFQCLKESVAETGTLPNDVTIGRCENERVGLVIASAESSLELTVLGETGETESRVYFPPEGQQASNPYSVDWSPGLGLAALSLFGTASVAVANPCTGEMLHVVSPWDADHPDVLLAVEPPIGLTNPMDVDGDGVTETTIASMLPRAPQGILWVEEKLWVVFSGFIEGATETEDAKYGPGVLISYQWTGDTLSFLDFRILPYFNPQAIVRSAAGDMWISYAGIWGKSNGNFHTTSPGYLEKISPDDGSPLHVIHMRDFAPGTPAVAEEWVVVGSSLRSEIALFPTTATDLDDAKIFFPDGAETESLFEAQLWGNDLAWVTQFSTDRIHVVDMRQGILNPEPFPADGILLASGGNLFRGAQAISIQEDDRDGDAALVLLGLSAEVVFLDLRQVFGP